MNTDTFPTWINQPSTLQPFHYLHGKRGTAWNDQNNSNSTMIWFLEDGDGQMKPIEVEKTAIQDGSRERYLDRVFRNKC
jgi:hypothetical protein